MKIANSDDADYKIPADQLKDPVKREMHSSSLPALLTVWRKSLLFNGNGYTVYNNSNGQIIFRVDNYASNWRQQTVLMDSSGNALLTIRRRNLTCMCGFHKLSILERWEAYKGDLGLPVLGEQKLLLFKASKAMVSSTCMVSMAPSCGIKGFDYQITWSQHQEWVKIFQPTASELLLPLVEISRKSGTTPEAVLLGKDVRTMRVQPEMDQAMAMAMVMIVDTMRS